MIVTIVTIVHEDKTPSQAHKTVLYFSSLVLKMTLKRKLGTDSKVTDNETKATRIPIVDRKKKPLTKSELMMEFKALEKKHEELLVENVKMREKLA